MQCTDLTLTVHRPVRPSQATSGCRCDPSMSERSETESERDLDNIEVISEPDGSSKRSSLRSGAGPAPGGGGGASLDRNDSSPPPHQVRPRSPLLVYQFGNLRKKQIYISDI